MTILTSSPRDVVSLCQGSYSKASASEELLPRGTNAPLVLAIYILNKFKNILKLKSIMNKNKKHINIKINYN